MKKTLALLLAFAGIASAATEIDLTGKWNGSTADISSETFVKGEITLAFLLSPELLTGNSVSNQQIFTLSGENYGLDDNDQTINGTTEVGWCFDSNKIYSYRYNSLLNSPSVTGLLASLPAAGAGDFEYATLVCTMTTSNASSSKLFGYLYFHDGNGDVIDSMTRQSQTRGITQTTKFSDVNDSYSQLNINESVVNPDQMVVYNGIVAGDLSLIAEDLVKANLSSTPGTDTTVPEPATATLSLLALAGLAARRRRK